MTGGSAKEDIDEMNCYDDEGTIMPLSEYMSWIIRPATWIHMWPVENKSSWKLIIHHTIVWIIFIYCLSFTLSFLIQIQMNFGNVNGIAENVENVTVYISGLFRYMYIYFMSYKYIHLVSLIQANFLYFSLFSSNNKVSLQKYYDLIRKIIVVYSLFTCFWIVQLLVLPIIKYSWTAISVGVNAHLNLTLSEIPFEVPLRAYFPMDISNLPGAAIFYAYETIAISVFTIIYILVDDFWYMVILLSVGQLELLVASINSLNDVYEDFDVPNEVKVLNQDENLELEKRLLKCIKHHQFMRGFILLVDEIFNPTVLMDTLHAIISIAFILLELTVSIKNGKLTKVLYTIQFLISSVVHMFIFDWLGNELAAKEEELYHAVGRLPWYRFPAQKDKILLMSIVSMRPHRLTGGKAYRLTLEFFTKTMRAIFSYFTFLLQINRTKQ